MEIVLGADITAKETVPLLLTDTELICGTSPEYGNGPAKRFLVIHSPPVPR